MRRQVRFAIPLDRLGNVEIGRSPDRLVAPGITEVARARRLTVTENNILLRRVIIASRSPTRCLQIDPQRATPVAKRKQ